LFVLNACSHTVQELEISTTPVQRPSLTLPPVDELNLRSVEWTVVTRDNFEEVLAELESNNQPLVLFAVTGDGYEALSLNVNDLRSQIEQLNTIIIAYENYYEQANRELDRAVILQD
jgi:hypothetical protein